MRKTKKIIALLLALAMLLSLVGCGKKTSKDNEDNEGNNNVTQTPTPGGDEDQDDQDGDKDNDLSSIIPAETVTLNVYSQLANYQGLQVGWFADVLLEKFNVKFNIISEGDGVFSTRMESGDLGDIVIFGNDGDDYQQAANNGMLFDWEEEDLVKNWGSFIYKNMSAAIDKNKNITGTMYGFGHDVGLTSVDFGDFDYHPDIRWDLYERIGKPEINELEDYIDVLKQMKAIEPTSDSGKETYGVSLFKDWDGNMVMFVKATATNFFGLDEFHFGFYDADNGNFEGALEENGHYYRSLKFYNKLYQENLLDPDSMTQGYDGTNEDYMDGSAFFCIFGWMGAPAYNTEEHVAAGKEMLPVAAKNQDTLVYGLNPAGSNRIWSIGANTQYPELAMAIINWLATPEGNLTMLYGPKDVTWEYLADGSVDLTDFGLQCKRESNVTMPEPYSGYYADGEAQHNNTTWSLNTSIIGHEDQTYNYMYWPKYLSLPVTPAQESWREATGADSFREYLSKFDYSVSKAHTYSETQKSDELDTTWNQVAESIRNGSWEAIYAKDDAEFTKVWNKMVEDAKSYGYEECIEYSKAEAAIRLASELD